MAPISSKKLMKEQLEDHLAFMYGEERCHDTSKACLDLVEHYRHRIRGPVKSLDEKDVVLITYGDQFQDQNPGEYLKTLHSFYDDYLKTSINTVHFLPFFPYTSDDGFSVVDYRKIDPELGDWHHVEDLAQSARLMFDAVVNHCSKSSPWFQGYLSGEPKYEDFFIAIDKNTDTSSVTRPRALPLLHPFSAHHGEIHVWTTFSEDQVDLNVNNPKVLLELLDVLLGYLEKGARLIRLDAIAFLWKELGTTCLHLEQTHRAVKIFRLILESVCEDVVIITETNVPHEENLSYFGDGTDEAHMVYNFTLPPLLAWSLIHQDCSKLRDWAQSLLLPSDQVNLFNFTASHDGIGMRPVQGILPPSEIDKLGERAIEHGGQVSYKDNGDGTKSPYELNCNYMDFITHPSKNNDEKIKRFLCTQAVMLAFPGVPGIYIHSLLGSANDIEGVQQTGRARSINRHKFNDGTLRKELMDPKSRRSKVFESFKALIDIRIHHQAFHPQSPSTYSDQGGDSIFMIERGCGKHQVLCLFNFSDQTRHVACHQLGVDLVSGESISSPLCSLNPWQFRWIETR